jgi:hypothetical protein
VKFEGEFRYLNKALVSVVKLFYGIKGKKNYFTDKVELFQTEHREFYNPMEYKMVNRIFFDQILVFDPRTVFAL